MSHAHAPNRRRAVKLANTAHPARRGEDRPAHAKRRPRRPLSAVPPRHAPPRRPARRAKPRRAPARLGRGRTAGRVLAGLWLDPQN
ncbi:hypothetical protein [Lysobacter gummosus]|uniref:hypothetical protein n=1 Tax=Lysobacter gummosus TaxID=262324 RepID=UPI0036405C68